MQEPQPGKNAFMYNGRLLVQYPRRCKSGPAGATASMPPRAPLNTCDAPQARLAPSRNATPAVSTLPSLVKFDGATNDLSLQEGHRGGIAYMTTLTKQDFQDPKMITSVQSLSFTFII